MDHLSGLDAAFLYLETPQTPMHVGGLSIFELPPGCEGNFLDDLRAHIARRVHLSPVFSRKLLSMPLELANPVWVGDDELDLRRHIRSAVLPKPGTRVQLDKLVGRLHAKLLDRSRPLWEFYVIEGVRGPAGASPGSRHVAFYSKVHHAALDGTAGVALAAAIMDVSAVPRDVGAGPPHGATRSDRVGMAELVGSGLRNTAVQTIKLARTLPTLARFAVRLLRPSKEEPVRAAKSGRASAKKTGWLAPKTPINVSLSERRAFSSFSLPQSQLKQIARGHGVTLNDVVLAICSGALRHYLADHNCKPKQPLLAAVPVSLREEGNTDMNTQASMLRISLASHIADPIARLLAIRKASASIKAQTDSVKSVLPTDFPSLGVPWLISGLAALYVRSGLADNMAPLANLIISNVRGSKVALYLAGARMLTYYPVSIPIHGMALNITVQSYNGSLDFGLIACAKAMPDLPVLAKHMKAAHLELLKLTPEVVVALKAKRS